MIPCDSSAAAIFSHWVSRGVMLISTVCATLIFAAASLAEDQAMTRHESTQVHMGTSFTIVVYAADRAVAEKGFSAAFARIKALDERLSDYKPDSELSRLSQASPTEAPVTLSDDLFRVLSESQKISAASDGAFDVTAGPLTRLWRRARRQKAIPAASILAEARAAVGFQNLRLDPKTRSAELLRPNMRIDLGGIGQGFAADEALAELRKLGLPRALVNASGDIAAGDAPPGESGWKIGIAPLAPSEPPSRFVVIKNRAVSTSGDAFQFVEIEGRRYSHIVDPHTGLGLSDRISVTVIAPDCTTADALATAVCVLGAEKGMKLIEKTEGAECLFVHVVVTETRVKTSKGFERYQDDKVTR